MPLYVAAVQNDYTSFTVTAAKETSRSHYTVMFQHYNGKTMNYAIVLSTIDAGMHTFIRQKQHWFRCTLRLLLRRRRYCKHNCTLARALSLLLLLGGDIESNPGPSREWLKKQARKQKYMLQREEILEKRRCDYAENPEPKRRASKESYEANAETKKAAFKANYSANFEVRKIAAKARYEANPLAKRAASIAKYSANPESMKAAIKVAYRSKVKSGMVKVAARAQYVKRRWLKIAASKTNYEQKKEQVNIYRRGKYALNEPRAYIRQQYAAELQKKLFSRPSLRLLLRKGYTENNESLAKKMSKGVLTT